MPPVKKIDSSVVSIAAVDVFCGVGGLSHGLIKAGVKVVAGIDIDEKCRFAFERNNQATFIHKGVHEITADEILALYPKQSCRILVGCAPCQPFSKHTQKERNRQSKEDWGLLYHFLRLIKETKPIVVSMENVPDIMKQKVFSDFVSELSIAGYNVDWSSVFCPDYGIPQSRTRLVLLASQLGKINLVPPTSKPNEYKTVRMAIGRLEAIDAGEASTKDRLHRAAALTDINLRRIRESKPGGTWRDWDRNLRVPCHRRSSGRTYPSVYSRMEWDKPSPTITTQFYNYGTGRFGHPEQHRAISVREAALLQTFPKGYKFVEPESVFRFKELGAHIGNAVPVRLAKIIGMSIIKHIESRNGRSDGA